jgi:hypothetical protein
MLGVGEHRTAPQRDRARTPSFAIPPELLADGVPVAKGGGEAVAETCRALDRSA